MAKEKITKKKIIEDVNKHYEHCVYHKGLPKEYKYGLTQFKKTMVNYVYSELLHLKNSII